MPYLDNLCTLKENISSTYAVYYDFGKAFDLFFYNVPLQKLANSGFDENCLTFFECYLYARSPQISINGLLAQTVDFKSEVLQSSVLGPLLFISFSNDSTDKIDKPSCYLSAHVSKLLPALTKPDLNLDTDHFTECADENRKDYMIDKCKSMIFQGKLVSSDSLLSKGIVNHTVDSIKDIVVIISNNIT